MKQDGVDEIVLETEYDNYAALSLYESLGFIREKRLHRFYLNGKDAFRLVLAIPSIYSDDTPSSGSKDATEPSSHPRLVTGLPRRHCAPPYRAIRVPGYSDDDDDTECVSAR